MRTTHGANLGAQQGFCEFLRPTAHGSCDGQGKIAAGFGAPVASGCKPVCGKQAAQARVAVRIRDVRLQDAAANCVDTSISLRVRSLSRLNSTASGAAAALLKRAHCAARVHSMAPANIFRALLDSASIAHDVAKLEALKANAKTEGVPRAPTSSAAEWRHNIPRARRRRPNRRRPQRRRRHHHPEKRWAPAGCWKGAARWIRRSLLLRSRAAASTRRKETTRRCSRPLGELLGFGDKALGTMGGGAAKKAAAAAVDARAHARAIATASGVAARKSTSERAARNLISTQVAGRTTSTATAVLGRRRAQCSEEAVPSGARSNYGSSAARPRRRASTRAPTIWRR